MGESIKNARLAWAHFDQCKAAAQLILQQISGMEQEVKLESIC